jgi:hypothetical protein
MDKWRALELLDSSYGYLVYHDTLNSKARRIILAAMFKLMMTMDDYELYLYAIGLIPTERMFPSNIVTKLVTKR